MAETGEIRRLSARWATDSGWPQRLEWVQIKGLRGWSDQRFEFRYPIMAIAGENGVGKTTVIQAAAAIYKSTKGKFASDYFPSSVWDKAPTATIAYSVLQGGKRTESTIKKSGGRWRGNLKRPERYVAYIDLSRVLPISGRLGYTRIVKKQHKESRAVQFDKDRLERLTRIMNRPYSSARMSFTDVDKHRAVPVLAHTTHEYSGYNQGQGETIITELLQRNIPDYSLVLIDEIESSLHPRSQRRLVRDLAELCRQKEWQVIFTTHSPYVLAELPAVARAYIMEVGKTREIVYGVSPQFALSKMDEVPEPECDIYVEDTRAQIMLTELLVEHAGDKDIVQRCQVIPYGAASVGKSLGQMVWNRRFKRKTLVFLDGDVGPAPGCLNLPGDDAPEIVVFNALKDDWKGVAERVGRDYADVADACERAMISAEHHRWVNQSATPLLLRGDWLWQAMCAEWAKRMDASVGRQISDAVQEALDREIEHAVEHVEPDEPRRKVRQQKPPTRRPIASSETPPLFAQLLGVPEE